MEYVTVKRFREYYNLNQEEVSDDFLTGYIKERVITEMDLMRRNWGKSAKALSSRGVTYGYNITNMIQRECRYMKSDENYESITHVILQMDIAAEYGLFETCYFVVDKQENTLYYSKEEIRLDYTKAKFLIEISNNKIKEIVSRLYDIITPTWEKPIGLGEKADYIWNIYIIMKEGDMIRYSGEGVDEERRPGFHEWYQSLYQEVKNA